MSTTIFKYTLSEFAMAIDMPEGAVILDAQMQDDRIRLWAAVDISKPVHARHFKVFGTGHVIPDGLEYIATVQFGPYVWHIFEACYQ